MWTWICQPWEVRGSQPALLPSVCVGVRSTLWRHSEGHPLEVFWCGNQWFKYDYFLLARQHVVLYTWIKNKSCLCIACSLKKTEAWAHSMVALAFFSSFFTLWTPQIRTQWLCPCPRNCLQLTRLWALVAASMGWSTSRTITNTVWPFPPADQNLFPHWSRSYLWPSIHI